MGDCAGSPMPVPTSCASRRCGPLTSSCTRPLPSPTCATGTWRMLLHPSWGGRAWPCSRASSRRRSARRPDSTASTASADGSRSTCPASWGPLTVVSAYVHAGEADTPKQVDKYAFLEAMDTRLRPAARVGHPAQGACPRVRRPERGPPGGRHQELARQPRARPASWRRSARTSTGGCRSTWVDLGRVHGGEGPGPYTWWSWRGKGFDTDGGWRIDYALATARASPAAARLPSSARRRPTPSGGATTPR